MKYIVIDETVPGSYWSSRDSTIYMSRRHNPQDFAHELAHVKLEHGYAYRQSAMEEFIEEKEAWMYALRRLPPEEIRLRELEHFLNSYIKGNKLLTRGQRRMAEVMRDKVIEYAKQRKKEAR